MIICLPSIVTCLFNQIFSSSGGPPYPADMRKRIIYSYEIITGVQQPDACRQHPQPSFRAKGRLEGVAHQLLLIKKKRKTKDSSSRLREEPSGLRSIGRWPPLVHAAPSAQLPVQLQTLRRARSCLLTPTTPLMRGSQQRPADLREWLICKTKIIS